MYRKVGFILFHFLLFHVTEVFAKDPLNSWQKVKSEIHQLSKPEKVLIDNMYIQSYHQKLGIWKKANYGSSIAELARPYDSNFEDILQINNLPQNTQKIYNVQWIFIPYSEKYLSNLEKSGINRMTWNVPTDEYIWPVEGVRITSRLGQRWGKFHPGVDIATPTGTLVLAAMDGEIGDAKFNGDYGKSIVLNHNENYITIYAHLSEIFVKKGDKIKKGQVIGLSGSTGRSTGPHLHFEVRYSAVVLNPEVFLPAFKESIYALVRNEETKEVSVSQNQ